MKKIISLYDILGTVICLSILFLSGLAIDFAPIFTNHIMFQIISGIWVSVIIISVIYVWWLKHD